MRRGAQGGRPGGRLRADPRFSAELAYCVPLGIPHSVLLGRVHPNPYDPEEPYWLPGDVATAIAWRMHEAGRCPRCGTFDEDWPDDYREDPTYETIEHRCAGCRAIAEANEKIPSGEKGAMVRLRAYDVDRSVIEAEAAEERDARKAEHPPDPVRPSVRGPLE